MVNFFVRSIIVALLGALSPSQQEQVALLDQQIEDLQDKKMGYEARALRHQDYAEYLQFDGEMVLETRRHLQLADENRAKAGQVQQQIDQLEQRKQQIIGHG